MRFFCAGPLSLLAAGLLLAGQAISQTPYPIYVDAVVTDPDGRPLAGVEFGDHWSSSEGTLTAAINNAETGWRSDEVGRVKGIWTMDPGQTPLFAISQDRRFAARVAYTFATHEGHDGSILGTIVLQPAIELVTEIDVPLSAGAPAPFLCTAAWITQNPDEPEKQFASPDLYQQRFVMKDGQVRVVVPVSPEHRYTLTVASKLASQSRTVIIPPGERRADLGAISLPFSPLELRGALFPDWHVDAAQGLPIEHCMPCNFRGKPVLVLLRFYSPLEHGPRYDNYEQKCLAGLAQHPQRDQFHVLILDLDPWHKSRVPSREPRFELFPVLTDWSGENAAMYGLGFDGAAIILDQQGRLDGYAPLDAGAKILERLLAAAKDSPR